MPQPVLVTGATGFIGGRLVRRLVERGDRVFCLVRCEQRAEQLRMSGVQLIVGDISDSSSVQKALSESRAATVFHLAGVVRAIRAFDFAHVNAAGTKNVASACGLCDSPPVLIVVSSLAAAGTSPEENSRTESQSPRPVSHYGQSKLAGEQATVPFASTVPITIVRPPVVFGPGDHAMLEVFRSISRLGVHLVPGWHGGDRRISLVHVDDLVEGLLRAASNGERLVEGGSPGQGVYFIAGEDSPTYADLGNAIAVALARRPPIVLRVPGSLLTLLGIGGHLMSRIHGRVGWINRDKIAEALAAGSWTCSSAKARQQLGWSPESTHTLAARLRQTALWYRRNGLL